MGKRFSTQDSKHVLLLLKRKNLYFFFLIFGMYIFSFLILLPAVAYNFIPLVNTPLPDLIGNTKAKMSFFSVAKHSTPLLKPVFYPESQGKMKTIVAVQLIDKWMPTS